MSLPKIFNYFSPGQIFTIDEARDKLQTTGNTLRKRLSELASKGYIEPIRQGLYRVSFVNPCSLTSVGTSPFVLGSKLAPQCYIGFKSALQFYANETPLSTETVYVVSPTKFNSFHYEGRYYYWCLSLETEGVISSHSVQNDCEWEFRITNFEKTIIDCLRRPVYSPTLPDFVRLCKARSEPADLALLEFYARACGVAVVFNRLGVLLQCMSSFWAISNDLLEKFEREMSRKQTEWPIFGGCARNSQCRPANFCDDLKLESNLEERWRIQLFCDP